MDIIWTHNFQIISARMMQIEIKSQSFARANTMIDIYSDVRHVAIVTFIAQFVQILP